LRADRGRRCWSFRFVDGRRLGRPGWLRGPVLRFCGSELALSLGGSLVQPSGELAGRQQDRSPDCLACGRRLAPPAGAPSSREPEPRPRGASPQAAHLLAGYLNFATRGRDSHGLGPIADSATGWHIVRSVLVRGLGALGPDRLLPPQAYAESRGPRWSRIHADWPPVGIIPPVQTMRAPPPALHRPGVAPCRLCVSAAQGDETWKAVVRAGSDASRWDGLKRHGAQSEGDHPSH